MSMYIYLVKVVGWTVSFVEETNYKHTIPLPPALPKLLLLRGPHSPRRKEGGMVSLPDCRT